MPTPDERYKLLSHLLSDVPDLESVVGEGRLSRETHMWLARAAALIEDGGDIADSVSFRSEMNSLPFLSGKPTKLMGPLYRALARAELQASPTLAGSFIHAGDAFDALASIGRVFGQAQKTLFIADPYLDEKVLTQFALLANEGVSLRMLTSGQSLKTALPAALEAWRQQYAARPLEVRVSQAKGNLHDRLVLVDGGTAWTLTQSFNSFATRSPASILRADAEIAAMKIAAYEDLWTAANPI